MRGDLPLPPPLRRGKGEVIFLVWQIIPSHFINDYIISLFLYVLPQKHYYC